MLSRRAIIGGVLSSSITKPVVARPRRKLPQIGGGGGGGDGGYVAKAVHFDGQTFLYRGDPLIGISDSPKGIISVWENITWAEPNESILIGISKGWTSGLPDINSGMTLTFGVGSANDGVINNALYVQDTNDTNDLYAFGGGTGLDGTGWHNSTVSWYTNFAAGARIVQFAFDGVHVSTSYVYENGGAFNVAVVGGVTIGAMGRTSFNGNIINRIVGDLSNFYVNLVDNIDLSVASNIEKFVISGKPVDPVNFPSGGTILLSGDALDFVNNQGSGGTFLVAKKFSVTGLASPGAVSMPGAQIGRSVILVTDTNGGDDLRASFESVISIVDEIQQIDVVSNTDPNGINVLLNASLTNAATSPSD